MRVLILGIDGYIGWPLCLHLTARGHKVAGIDNFNRRMWVKMVGGQSVTPISGMYKRKLVYKKKFGKNLEFHLFDIQNYRMLKDVLRKFKPDAIVHLAEQPSAPFSMRDAISCLETYRNNILGTLTLIWAVKEVCPKAHLVKLGTMGVYSYELPIDVPEGDLEIEYKGKKVRLPYPKLGGSWYHREKSCDSVNLEFANQVYRLSISDVHQGVVYGTRTDEIDRDELLTRFDVDECFSTAINRFVTQAVSGLPITLYGKGHQKRGFIPLRDSIECLRILIENPPKDGEYRVVNQIENHYDLTELAQKVKKIAKEFGIDAKITNIENPRVENEDNYYNPEQKKLLELGYQPTSDMEKELRIMFKDIIKFKNRIKKEVIMPKIKWRG